MADADELPPVIALHGAPRAAAPRRRVRADAAQPPGADGAGAGAPPPPPALAWVPVPLEERPVRRRRIERARAVQPADDPAPPPPLRADADADPFAAYLAEAAFGADVPRDDDACGRAPPAPPPLPRCLVRAPGDPPHAGGGGGGDAGGDDGDGYAAGDGEEDADDWDGQCWWCMVCEDGAGGGGGDGHESAYQELVAYYATHRNGALSPVELCRRLVRLHYERVVCVAAARGFDVQPRALTLYETVQHFRVHVVEPHAQNREILGEIIQVRRAVFATLMNEHTLTGVRTIDVPRAKLFLDVCKAQREMYGWAFDGMDYRDIAAFAEPVTHAGPMAAFARRLQLHRPDGTAG